MSPLIAVHLTAALGAVATGAVALWARRAALQYPRLHRAFGYAFVTFMLVTASSAIFIRDFSLPNIAGYTPIHLLVPVTFGGVFIGMRFIVLGRISAHRKAMKILYISACVVTGALTLLPQRYLGQLVWHQWLGLI